MHSHRLRAALLTISLAATASLAVSAAASQPGWSPTIIATGQQREQIRSLPIEQRPYRPLHFYGNTVRRMHYRGTPLPSFTEAVTLPTQILRPR